MRQLPEGMAEALAGSSVGARIQFNVWYNGDLIAGDVPVGAWSADWDSTQQIVATTSATVLDEDGTLTPWAVDDALGVAGPMLQTQLVVGDTSINVGFQRITESEPEETWRIVGGRLIWVPGAATIPVTAQDLTVMASGSRFMAPERVPLNATVFSEVRRLLRGITDVIIAPTLVDRSVPRTLVYKEDRMDAIEDLIKGIDGAHRMAGGGQFEIYDPSVETSVFEIRGGDEGQLINLKRKLSIEGLYNAVISQNTLDGGQEIQGVAVEDSGPLRLDGPHGRWPTFRSAPFAETQDAINRDAKTALANRVKSRTVVLPLRTTLNPAIEVGDWVTARLPILTGQEVSIPGRVSSISWAGDGNGIGSMELKIVTKLADMEAVSRLIRGTTWDQ
ncbi:minor tail protein [Arthrobacter phage Edmundo]|nr:minor tail protein [Arthrobacter phage Edmundo]